MSSSHAFGRMSDAGRKLASTISDITSSITVSGVDTSGVAIVAACMNRQGTLKKVLPTWLNVKGVDEVIIVDWGSDPPLKPIVQPEQDKRLKLFRVNTESSWVLSRAYNLAVNLTKREYVIRTDCDYSLHPDILQAHNLSKTEEGFYSGNWILARNENEVHLNGAMIMKRSKFWNVGGYDERIQTYGWDDEDLYIRLRAANMKKLNISYDHVMHVSHGDGKRAQKGVKFAQVQIDVNALLLEKLPQWTKDMKESSDASQYKTLSDNNDGYIELEAIHVPAPLKKRVEETVYKKSWDEALGRRLADDHQVPWDVLGSLTSEKKELLLRQLMKLQYDLETEIREKQNNGKESDKKIVPTKARLLLIHCMHGLGNRLRALGSALAFAKNTRRVPIIIWESDAHIAAEFDALFSASEFVLMKQFVPKWPFTTLHQYDDRWKLFQFYNYMEVEEGAKKGEIVQNDPEKHIYYKGAYIMEAPGFSWWEEDNTMLKSLQPVKFVTDRLEELEKDGLSNAVGVHIRNRTLAKDIKNVDFNQEYGSDAAKTMEHWRTQSSYKTFISEMDRIIREEDENARFYIATDTYEVIPLMQKRFPGKIISTDRSCDDRDSECVKYAVIDMYALSKTKQLLGSNWSSYTEMAERLGGLKAKLAGQDFGPALKKEEKKEKTENPSEKSVEELEVEQKDRELDSTRE